MVSRLRAGEATDGAFAPQGPRGFTKVVYVLGASRSGSTLLTSLMGEIDGFFAAAELSLLWHELESRACGCGLPVLDCHIWSPAISDALRRVSGATPTEVIGLQHNAVRARHLRHVRRARADVGGALGTYGQVVRAMYSGVARSAGANVVVDSSKNASEALLLTKLDGIDPYLVQMVRDPRAVAYSWLRAIRKGRQSSRHRRTAFTAARWVEHNLLAEWVGKQYGRNRVAVVRYEDLVARPRETLGSVAHMVGESVGDLSFLSDPTTSRTSRHMVGGNALRFGEGVVQLKEDTEWTRSSRMIDLAGVTAVTLPLLSRYGYKPLITRS